MVLRDLLGGPGSPGRDSTLAFWGGIGELASKFHHNAECICLPVRSLSGNSSRFGYLLVLLRDEQA